MKISSRVQGIAESVTLKLNAKAVALSESGKKIYNLTAGQLPFMPMEEFVDAIRAKSGELKSYQYCPAAGFPDLRKCIIKHIEKTRFIDFKEAGVEVDAIISNGAKHSLYNVLTTLIDSGDEVVMMAPYWISYTEMIKLCGGTPVIVNSTMDSNFVPSLDELKSAINKNTRVLMINSPNNPSGTHYPEKWVEGVAKLLSENPQVSIISDEIYYELNYSGEVPTFVYQYDKSLLERTIIIDGISKTLASTGLRLGYIVAPKALTGYIAKLQGQTSSGSNSLIQRAFFELGPDKSSTFLKPINTHLKGNAELLKAKLEEYGLSACWYNSTAAFYFMVDFSKTPRFAQFAKESEGDYAASICEAVLENHGIAMVPGTDFGIPNSGRISLVLDSAPFSEALDILFTYLRG
ncbi:MAG: aminotransferase class I/II-fold pyridoxal phosphate-dependent enzyme [Bacteriovoracaceae bacterium]|nr:aminotransferase class I/II-fold pyridoxal phosphate-dependent enzyme [Bacteriovoracaceae bacterium]